MSHLALHSTVGRDRSLRSRSAISARQGKRTPRSARFLGGLLGIVILAATLACGTEPTATSVKPSESPAHASGTASRDDANVTLVARGIALALADSTLRIDLRDVLRSSPFRSQSVHLASFLLGSDGRALATAAAAATGVSLARFDDAVVSLPSMAFGMPSLQDRRNWSAGSNFVVTGTTMSPEELAGNPIVIGFDAGGRQFSIDATSERHTRPVFTFSRASFGFGADPEAMRRNAPRRPVGPGDDGIAGPGGDVTIMSEPIPPDCDPNVSYCGPMGNSIGPSTDIGYACGPGGISESTAPDADRDYLKDACEQQIALAFEPNIVWEAQEMWWAREPHYIVQRIDGTVTIGYLLSIYYDGGAVSHNGDSEMIIVRLYPVNSTTWSVLNLTTTAHYGATMGFMFDETRTTTYAAFQFSGTHAKVFASRNHHGLYESKERCSARVGDTCSTGLGDGGFLQPAGLGYAGWSGIRPDNNIGNITTPLVIDPWMNFGTTPGFKTDCTYADNPARTAYECFLRGSYYNSQTGQLIGYATTFAGWAGSGGTTPYSQLMQDFGFNNSMMY